MASSSIEIVIKPYASDELRPLAVEESERARLLKEAETLPSLLLNSAAAANAVMLGAGYFSPLSGYMDKADALGCAKDMKLGDGLFWPTPVLNRSDSAPELGRLALRDPNMPGQPIIAVQDVRAVEALADDEQEEMIRGIFGTDDLEHPGVATFSSLGRNIISGPIQTLNFSYFEKDFAGTFRTAGQIRDEIAERGWRKVVAFQTRNPMHRAHEELCRMSQEMVGADGILIHMLLGKLKSGDIPAKVRDAAIRTMVEVYFPPNTVMISGYGFDMLYAGPREALLHALFRQNSGCTHLIVGRDHAGVGDYYGAFDAQKIFDDIPDGAMQIEIIRADHTAYSRKLGKVVMMRDAPDHKPEDFVLLSGTKVREMLGRGEPLPEEFARPEVAKILMDYYRSVG